MRDGTFNVFIEDGKTLGVFINSGLDSIYRSIFLKSLKLSKRKKGNLEQNITSLVFGFFWLEAHCNTQIQSILEYRGTKREKSLRKFDQSVREIVVRANFGQKLSALAQIADSSLYGRFVEFRSEANTLFELRNRLAHFKDNDEEIHQGPISEVRLIELMRAERDPRLIAELRDVRAKCEVILKIGQWIDEIHKGWKVAVGSNISTKKPAKRRPAKHMTMADLSTDPN
jgi:hypothetical protein